MNATPPKLKYMDAPITRDIATPPAIMATSRVSEATVQTRPHTPHLINQVPEGKQSPHDGVTVFMQ